MVDRGSKRSDSGDIKFTCGGGNKLYNSRLRWSTFLFLSGWFSAVLLNLPAVSLADSLEKELGGKTCEIWMDEQKIPHLFADTEDLGFACLGYVHGRDRGWQMDYFKKIVQGRKAEYFGKNEIQSDFLMRLLALDEKGSELFRKMNLNQQKFLRAYALGVNRGMKESSKESGYEFRKFGYQPDPWNPEDTLALILLQAFDQTKRSFQTQRDEQTKIDQAHHDNPDKSNSHPPGPSQPNPSNQVLLGTAKVPWETTILKSGEYPKSSSSMGDHANRTHPPSSLLTDRIDSASMDFPDVWGGIGMGSNNWVLSPARSESGSAWLANDPHLRLSHPPFWKWIHLKAGALDVMGATLPGVPLVVSGANRHLSWGLTNSFLPVSRLSFVPEKDLDQAKTIRPWIWFKFWKFKLPFFFKTFRKTPRGFPVLPLPSPPGTAMVLRWTGFDLDSEDFSGLFEIMGSKNSQEADRSFSRVRVPSWNFVFADDHGSVGYRSVGKVPRFEKDPGLGIPTQRLTEVENSASFDHPLNSDEMPHLLNPSRGMIVTANNQQWPSDSHLSLGHAQMTGFRAFRIEELLLQTPKHRLETIQKVQCDVQAPDARFILPELLKILKSYATLDQPREKKAIEALQNWNFEADLECTACGIYRRWVDHLFQNHNIRSLELYLKLVQESGGSQWREGVVSAFHLALDDLGIRNNKDLRVWKDIHLNSFEHLAGPEYFTAKPIGTPGDENSVNPGSLVWMRDYFQHTAGASERLIVEMSQPPKVYSVLAGSNEDIDHRNLFDPESEWQKWLRCKQIRRHFPIERSEIQEGLSKIHF